MVNSARLAQIGLGAALVSVSLAWLLQPPRLAAGASEMTVAAATTSAACDEGHGTLTDDEVSDAVREFIPGVLPCVSSEGPPESTLRLRLHVACTGAIENVELVEGGDWPGHVVGCVQDRLAKVTFPAHGLADGAFVDLPMRFPALDASARPR